MIEELRSWRKLHYTTLKIEKDSELYQKWLEAPMILWQEEVPKDYFYEMDLKGASGVRHTTLAEPYNSVYNDSEWEAECFMYATSDPWSINTTPVKETSWEEEDRKDGEADEG